MSAPLRINDITALGSLTLFLAIAALEGTKSVIDLSKICKEKESQYLADSNKATAWKIGKWFCLAGATLVGTMFSLAALGSGTLLTVCIIPGQILSGVVIVTLVALAIILEGMVLARVVQEAFPSVNQTNPANDLLRKGHVRLTFN